MKNMELVRTTPLKGLVAARAGGANPVDAYAQLIEVIRQRCGDDTATLFAEPHLVKAEAAEPGLTWYTSLSGPMTALPNLDEVARAPVLARLQERLEKLKPLLRDKQLGPMTASWLYVPSAEHILSVGGDPLLIGWGHVPQDIALSPSRRAQLFAETLGRYAPGLHTPPFTPQEATDYVQEVTAAAKSCVPASANAAAVTVAGISLGAVPVRRERGRAPWIASLIAAIVLAMFMIPGVLLYPIPQDNSTVERRESLLREDNKGLADRLRELEAASRQRVCRLPNGQLRPLPAAQPNQPPGRPGSPGNPTPHNATPATPPPRADLLPPPNQVQLPRDPAASTGTPTALNDLIDLSVVFVMGQVVDNPRAVGMGTGFFVTADRVVTNRHVIEDLVPSTIIITNKRMGQALSAHVIAKTEPPPAPDLSVRDFALLAVDSPGKAIVKLGPSIEKSASVAAAGYPLFLVESDPGYQRLKGGDRSASPDNTVQYGFVIQKRDTDPVKLVTHSAPLGHGNSGGPLFDLCGRVVGVNTAVRNEGAIATSANFAQDVGELHAFLSENGIAAQVDETRTVCPPPVTQAAAAPNPQPPHPPAAQQPQRAPQPAPSQQPAPPQAAPGPSR
jgi:hypothetical protein